MVHVLELARGLGAIVSPFCKSPDFAAVDKLRRGEANTIFADVLGLLMREPFWSAELQSFVATEPEMKLLLPQLVRAEEGVAAVAVKGIQSDSDLQQVSEAMDLVKGARERLRRGSTGPLASACQRLLEGAASSSIETEALVKALRAATAAWPDVVGLCYNTFDGSQDNLGPLWMQVKRAQDQDQSTKTSEALHRLLPVVIKIKKQHLWFSSL
jgi:hypothetical protein